MGRRNRNRADFMQRYQANPKLIFPFEHQHDPVTFLNTMLFEHVCGLIAQLAHFQKGKLRFIAVDIAPFERHFVRYKARVFINDIETEIEIFRNLYFKIFFEIFIRRELCFTESV